MTICSGCVVFVCLYRRPSCLLVPLLLRRRLVGQNTYVDLCIRSLTFRSLVSGGKHFIVVGTEGGVYICVRGDLSPFRLHSPSDIRTDIGIILDFRRILTFQNTLFIASLQHHRKVIIHTSDGLLLAYSMDIMARVGQGTSPPKALDASMEKVSGSDNVVLAKVGIVKERTIGKLFLSHRNQAKSLIGGFSGVCRQEFPANYCPCARGFGAAYYFKIAPQQVFNFQVFWQCMFCTRRHHF